MEPHGLEGARVLVTGATGFIGQRLVERLVVQERADVRILARTVARAKPLARFPLDVRIGDVTDPAAVEAAVADCAVVVNCAKGAGADPAARRAVDVDGVRNVLAAAGRTGARRVVHVSTVAVHELPVSGEYDERAPLSVSKEPYVAGKRDGHRLALDAGRSGSLPVSVVQPTVVYGPGASIYGRDIIDELRTSLVPLVDGGSGTCNAVFVDDVVSGIMLAATAERAPGEAFILSGPEPVTWNAFYGAFSAMLGADSTVSVSPEQALQQWKESARRPWLVPEWLRSVRQDAVLRDRLLSTREGNLVRRAAFRVLPDAYFAPERWEPPMTDDDAEPALATFRPDVIARLSSRAVASTRKARELLGYEPLFDLGAGMRLTEAWARAEGLLPGSGRVTEATAETHLVLVWERARAALDRILDDAARRFVVRDVVEVTWRPERFRRSLSRLYGTDLPVDSGKERESGTGPFVVAVVDDERPRTVARRTQHGWEQANASLLAAKRRYRGWAGGSYRVHTTLTPVETTRDAMLILGESLDALRARTWDGGMRAYERDLLGDPAWDDLGQLRAGLSATMRCAFPPTGADGPVEVVTDDAWWAIRIVDPPTAEGCDEPEVRLRRPVVAGSELPVLVHDVADPDAHPAWAALLPSLEEPGRPTLRDRLETAARLRS